VTADLGSGRPAASGWTPALADALGRLPLRAHRWLPLEQRVDLRHALGRFRPWEDGFDLNPPPPRPGETTGPPGYVGVGSTAAGAGWWHRLITDHPAVSARPDLPPARHVLSHFATDAFGPEQQVQYDGWFPRRPGTLAGEWTPTYWSLPWVAPLLHRAAPEARVLVIVRDPVARLPIALAGTGEHRISQTGSAIAEAFDGGFFGAHLRQVLDHVPADQVLVLQYERCLRDRDAQLAATYRFLGLDDSHRPGRWSRPAPVRSAPMPDLDPDTRDRLVELYADDVAELVALDPGLDLSLWPDFDRA
jgi:hypothetical protein